MQYSNQCNNGQFSGEEYAKGIAVDRIILQGFVDKPEISKLGLLAASQ